MDVGRLREAGLRALECGLHRWKYEQKRKSKTRRPMLFAFKRRVLKILHNLNQGGYDVTGRLKRAVVIPV